MAHYQGTIEQHIEYNLLKNVYTFIECINVDLAKSTFVTKPWYTNWNVVKCVLFIILVVVSEIARKRQAKFGCD